LLESSPTPATRELLRAGLADRPRHEVTERAAIALGLAVGVAATTGAASAAAAAAVTSAAAGSAKAAGTSLGGLTLTKWLAMGMTAGAVAAGGAAAVRHEAARNQLAPNATPPAALAAPSEKPALKSAQNRPIGALEPALTHHAAEPASAPAVMSSAGTARPAASDRAPLRPPTTPNALPAQASRAIAREVAQIDAARAALASGDSTRALAELNTYERLRETPTFVREAELLRIEALSTRGDSTHAAELARAYVKRFPNDAHVPRLREQFGRAEGANQP
jgi:hypothetical protein